MKKIKDYLAGRTEYLIGIGALIVWLFFELFGRILGWETYPVGYFQKIAFGVLGMSLIAGITWLWFGATFPSLKKLIDPDSLKTSNLTEWQTLKLSLFFWAFYAGGAVLLASLY